MDIGKKITEFRQVQKLTQKELAKLAGISESHLRRIEQGENIKPSPKTLSRIAFALNITLDDLAL